MPIKKIASYLSSTVFATDLSGKPENRKLNIGWCSVFPPTQNGAAAVAYYHFREIQKDNRINLFAIPVNGRIDKKLFPGIKFARLEDSFLDAVIFFGIGLDFEKNAAKTNAKKIAWQTMHFTPKERESEKQLFEQLKKADSVIMISEWAMRTYKENGLTETKYVPHGIDLKLFKKKNSGNKVLFVSRGDYKKGVIPFLECAKRVLSRNGSIVFELNAPVDKNSKFLEEIELKIAELKKNFPKNIVFEKEWIDYGEIPEKYNGSFVLVFPSNNEGFGVPLIEAMACGIPSIVFDRKPMNEIVKDKKTGYCIKANSESEKKYHGYKFPDEKEMAERIISLFENKKLLSELSKNCIKRAKKNYSLETVAGQLVDIAIETIGKENFCRICGKKTSEKKCLEHGNGFSAKEFDKVFSESTYEEKNPVFASIFTENKLRRRINQFINRREHYLFGFLKGKIGKTSNVLDFGCGYGSWTFDLKKEFGSNVFAFDISKNAVKYAKQKTEECGEKVFFCVADACQLPFKDNCFDAAFSQDVLGHLHEPETALAEAHRIIKDNGLFSLHSETSDYRKRFFHKKIINELEKDPWVSDAGHISIMPKKILEQKIFSAGFEIEQSISPAQRLSFLLNPGDFNGRGLKQLGTGKFGSLWLLKKYHNVLGKVISVPIMAKTVFAANAFTEFIETKLSKETSGGSAYFLLKKKNKGDLHE